MTPYGFYKQKLRHWIEQYGSEVPDELFRLARIAWLEILTMKQPAFEQSLALRQTTNQAFQNFAAAKEIWEKR